MVRHSRILGFCFSLWLLAVSSVALGASLPAEEGKEAVESQCSVCHPVSRISQSLGYHREGWLALMGTMVDLSGDPARRDAIASYLAEYFPPNERRAPTLVEGDTEITFIEWVVPTLGQRSRDPAEAPDGGIWWAGQWGNLVGRIDPATGEMREYPLPPGSMPHSVTLGSDGGVWYTGNQNGTIGRLDPQSGHIDVYDMPDPSVRDPHTAVFDDDGILWFTAQQANRIGRLDPVSGEVTLVTLPTPGARPYGIKIDAEGNPWVSCNGSNCLVQVDPKTMALDEVELPHQGTTVRRLDIAEDGMIWYVNSGRGRLGRYNPRSGEVREWPSPSGERSHPYAIAVVDGVVWYNESGMRPDALVRFDPATEAFQSWPIPSGGVYAGIVRHMRPTLDGDLLIHQSATNRIMRVDIGD
ncbi:MULTISPECIES: hypothetical protein [unclassified Halomonas]|uniref:Vgb family protein n=1 Tax=unclassified Halomonas TaxID=2609666 RepID=UPI001C93928F|nr:MULTISPECIES: hypothetical protein [unclassified Halomonas]MBY5926943.1 hypothetical protein [Halomonas sp. DP4Y7-2]MBY6233985.1 hypothetical protein [Halomonas sp. DP4Y7-1]